MKKHLLSFVTDENGEHVSIHADLAGVEFLISELEYIKEKLEANECPHSHLFTEEWGSDELSSTKLATQSTEKNQVHHVKIYGWNDEWKVKHKLAEL